MAPKRGAGIFSSTLTHILLVLAIGALSYSNTFDAPFQWDEKVLIEQNDIVKDLGYFLSPSEARGEKFHAPFVMRYVGYLSFALNYAAHGSSVGGYHAVNLAVHLMNALLVYLIAALSFRTPLLRGSRLAGSSGPIAFYSALLFAVHPVQTEAVTYVFQRLASLAAFFYLLSLAAYIKSRLAGSVKGRYGFYALSIAGAVLAMKTKENAFTLPFAILLFEYIFFDGRGRRAQRMRGRLLRLAPILLTLIIVPLSLRSVGAPLGEMLGGSSVVAVGQERVSSGEYLLTQGRVLVTYLRLLVLPVNQNVDYDYPVYRSLFEMEVLSSMALLLGLLLFALYMLKRSIKGEPAFKVVSFGILWFFLTLSVESSVVPLPMLINEYRMYLPSAWLFIGATAGVFLFIERLKQYRVKRAFALTALTLIVITLSATTYARNSVWRTEAGLWEDTARKSPQKARVHRYLGNAYLRSSMYEKAIGELKTALRLNPYSVKPYNDLGAAYKKAGMNDGAEAMFRAALRFDAGHPEAHYNLGLIYLERAMYGEAAMEFEAVLRADPGDWEALRLLRYAQDRLGLRR